MLLHNTFCLGFSGKNDMRAELDEVSVYIAKNTDKNISMSEKMTQTDWHMFDRHFSGAESTDYKTTPNGTSPCNHPSLSCQVSCPNFCIKVHSLDDALTYAFMWCSKVKNPILSSPSLHFSNANSNCLLFPSLVDLLENCGKFKI